MRAPQLRSFSYQISAVMAFISRQLGRCWRRVWGGGGQAVVSDLSKNIAVSSGVAQKFTSIDFVSFKYNICLYLTSYNERNII